MNHLQVLYCICYNIASVLWVDFFGSQACRILVPLPGIELTHHTREGKVPSIGSSGKSPTVYSYWQKTITVTCQSLVLSHFINKSPSSFSRRLYEAC